MVAFPRSFTAGRCSFRVDGAAIVRTRREKASIRYVRRGEGTAAAARRRREPRRRWWGATLPRSVTVGDRLAQKSDRHRPLSLRPVSLRRRIYMQFLLIVLLLWWRLWWRGPHHQPLPPPPTPLNSAYRNNRTRAVVTKILENITKTFRRGFFPLIFNILLFCRNFGRVFIIPLWYCHYFTTCIETNNILHLVLLNYRRAPSRPHRHRSLFIRP